MPYRLFLCLFLITILGCGKSAPQKPVLLTPSEAEKHFVKICLDDYSLNIVTKRLDNTLWVIYPSLENFFEIKASMQGPNSSSESTEAPAIKYLDAKFENDSFNIQYDIGTAKSYMKDFGYSTGYSEKIQENQRNIMAALSRAFAEADRGEQPTQQEKIPTFIVLVIADITNGIEMKSFLTYEDLKRAMEDQSFYEEFVQRMIIDYPEGNINLIGDKTGESITAYDLTWGEFLAKQIVYRINFKYQRSAFPPSKETPQELLKIVSNVVGLYKFENFNQVSLENLDSKETISIAKDALPSPDEDQPAGRIINIKFVP